MFNCINFGMSIEDIHSPNTHQQTMATQQREEWRKEEAIKIESMFSNKAFVPALLPAYRRAIRLMYRIKYDKNGVVKQNKARSIALGYQQVYGADYSETYFSVAV